MFIDELDLSGLGFADAAGTGRPGYNPAMMPKLYLYGYLNQVQLLPAMADPVLRAALPGLAAKAERYRSVCSGGFLLAASR